ncbi:MFS transporter [Trichococcus flocculiformis]|uniref:MFS transporter n=1 Tax=Trichococcus flocculiformis TaxID=82803 RepID=UPI002AABFC74|nr:glycoside-pentoside-hexuronide (GPH):cation symporter [Trichococcus flocculiformis]
MEKRINQEVSKKMPLWYTPAWASRSISVAISVILMMQVTYYSTEVLGLGSGVVGVILLVSKLFDGITDLLVGFAIDRTDTKLGKARPYELFIIPLWILIILLFSTPNFGETGKIIYVFIMYTLIFSVCSTFLMASETVYLGRAVQDGTTRGKLLSISGVLTMLFSAAVSIMLPSLMATLGTQPGGWTKISLILGIPMMLMGMIRFVTIKEKRTIDTETKEEKISIKKGISILKQNKYIFILSLIILGANLVQNIVSVAGTYYFTYVIGNLSLLGIVGLVGLAAPFVLLLFPAAIRTIGAVGFVRIGLILATIANVLRFIFPTNLPVVYSTVMISGIGASTITMMNSYFILQCIDYGEQKTGIRVEGLPTSVTNFAAKIGQGIAAVSVGFVMALGGYIGSQAEQSASAIFSIRSLYSLIPAAICMLMLIALHFYDIEKKMESFTQ